jgi:hypothetical protein
MKIYKNFSFFLVDRIEKWCKFNLKYKVIY